MSTIISRAFRFNADVTFEHAIELCWGMRPLAHDIQMIHLAKEFAKVVEELLVRKYRFGHELERPPIIQAMNQWRDSVNEKDIHFKGLNWDTEFDIMLYRITDEDYTKPIILGCSVVGQQAFHELVMNTLPVHSYEYWDNTDRPDDVSASQWKKRLYHWQTALPGLGSRLDSGIRIRLAKSDPPWPEVKGVLAHLDVEDIIPRQARKLVMADMLAACSAAMPQPRGAFSMAKFQQNTDRARAWLEGDEGQQAIEEEAARLRHTLPDVITGDMI